MAPPAAGIPGGPQKIAIQVRLSEETVRLADAFAAEMSAQTYGAQFSRAEAIRIAAEEWLRAHQAGKSGAAPVHHATVHPVVVSEPDPDVAEDLNLDLDPESPVPTLEKEEEAPPASRKKGGRPARR